MLYLAYTLEAKHMQLWTPKPFSFVRTKLIKVTSLLKILFVKAVVNLKPLCDAKKLPLETRHISRI